MSYAIQFTNLANSLVVNCGPLFKTIDSGIPKRAKTVLSTLMVAVAVVEFILKTPIHFKYTSMIKRLVRLSIGPSKSMCIRDHDLVGHCHKHKGATGEAD